MQTKGCFTDLRNFSYEKTQLFNYYRYSKTKDVYFRILFNQFKIFSHKISYIRKTTFRIQRYYYSKKVCSAFNMALINVKGNPSMLGLVTRKTTTNLLRFLKFEYCK